MPTDHGVACDINGNAYMTGAIGDTMIYGMDTLKNYWQVPFLVKYDPNGNVVWATSAIALKRTITSQANSVATDMALNVFICGQFWDSLEFGTTVLTTKSIASAFLTKYDLNGNVLWAEEAIPTTKYGGATANSVATDKFGNSYVTGYFGDSLVFGTDTLKGSLQSSYVFLVKYDVNGNVLWARQSKVNSRKSNGAGVSVATDKSGSVYVGGNFQDTISFNSDSLFSSTAYNYTSFLTKYDANGNLVWVKQAVLPKKTCSANLYSITTDAFADIYVVGSFLDSVTFGSYLLKTFNTGTAAFIVKYDSSGHVVWAKQAKPITNYMGGALAYSIACDTIKNNCFISISAFDSLRFGTDTIVTPTFQGSHIIEIDTAGNLLCSTNFSEDDEDDGSGVAVAPGSKYVYVAGDFGGPILGNHVVAFGLDTLTPVPVQVEEQYFIAQWIPCCTLNVTVSPSDTAICPGNAVALKAGGISPYTYTWSPSAGLSGTTGAMVTATPTANAKYTVTGDSAGCKGTASATININPLPVITLTSSPANDSICMGDSAHITANGGTSYLWSPGNSNSSSIWVKPVINATYSLTVTKNGCKADTDLTVYVNPPPTIVLTPPSNICPGKSITLSATGGGTYKWSDGSTASSISVSPTVATSYTVVVNKVCADSASTSVSLYSPVLIVCCNDTIQKGDTAHINASNAVSYVWSPSESLSCTTCADPIANPATTTTYSVLATDADGCQVSKDLTVYVETPCADFTVPNVFTPNNDGINDDFAINVLNPLSYNISIYDRWGKQVFTSSDASIYWNGRINGTTYLVPDGVYYYTIKSTCGSNDYEKKGFVEVMGER